MVYNNAKAFLCYSVKRSKMDTEQQDGMEGWKMIEAHGSGVRSRV